MIDLTKVRPALCLLGVVSLVSACGGDDGTSASGFNTVGMTETGTTNTGDGDGDGDPGDGDPGDGDPGDGDGDPGDGDPGDGDGDPGDGDGDPGDGDGDPGDGDGDPGKIPCEVPEVTIAPSTPQVMLVLDKSGSMLTDWDHDNDVNTAEITRWHSLHNAVSFIVTTFDAQMDFGAMLFPSVNATNTYGNQGCVTSNQPEFPIQQDGQGLLAGIPGPMDMTLAGGTPGEDAVDVSGTYLQTLNPLLPKVIIYISDGAANCGDAAQTAVELFEDYDLKLPMTIADLWTNEEIPTYVVGIDISTMMTPVGPNGEPDGIVPWCKMDELGELGGKPKDQMPGMSCQETATDAQDFYPAGNEIELQAALEEIIADAINCTINLEPVPPFPELLEVEIDGNPIPHVMDCLSEDGWVYTNPNGPYDSIEMCGAACDELVLAGEADVLYFCDPG